MSCCCNTYNDKEIQYLDIEGVRFFVSLVDRVIDTRDKGILKLSKIYTNEEIEKAEQRTDQKLADLKQELLKVIEDIDYLPSDALSLEGTNLKIKLKDGSFKTIDLSGIGGANVTYAEISDIEAMFL